MFGILFSIRVIRLSAKPPENSPTTNRRPSATPQVHNCNVNRFFSSTASTYVRRAVVSLLAAQNCYSVRKSNKNLFVFFVVFVIVFGLIEFRQTVKSHTERRRERKLIKIIYLSQRPDLDTFPTHNTLLLRFTTGTMKISSSLAASDAALELPRTCDSESFPRLVLL